ncbi:MULTISPECIES: sensor histidine kinase [unclassified Streptomyces]|uniref:sensor histidine kinase n=1 Tax=unclassified Streptomyces TaxID=2593676 RepID=UPI0036EA8797
MENRRRGWLGAHTGVRDAIPPLVITLAAVPATAFAGGHWHQPSTAGVAWVALSCFPLLLRYRWPVHVVAAVVAVQITQVTVGHNSAMVALPAIVALYTVGLLRPGRTAWISGAIAAAALSAAGTVLARPAAISGDMLLWFDLLMLATGLGVVVRVRRERLASIEARAVHAEETREAEARRRVTEERVRIARELHDVVAHHITLVNAQAGVAQHLVRTDAEKAYQALGAIKETSRSALDELRATVGLLRYSDDDTPLSLAPTPGLDGLDSLVDGFRQAGQSIRLARSGKPRQLAPSTDLAAYRIIQEALTNAHKHARASLTEVTLAYGERTLEITVADNGRGTAKQGAGTGHGLIGMRERATAFGGTLTAGPAPHGGYRVHATLPLPQPPKDAA